METGKEEQRSVVRFLTAEGVERREIHRRMSVVYGEHSVSHLHVLAWHKRFREGRVSLQDNACPGQARHIITPDVIGHIRANWRITSLFFFTRLHY
jgi:transposase